MNDVTPWPEAELEHLGRCLLCGETDRSLVFDDLQDRVTRAAPGRWSLHRCANCGLFYLDPRPDPASIGRAYSTYYTHDEDDPSPAWDWPGLRKYMRRAYLNRRYGHRFLPALPFGDQLMRLKPPACRRLDLAIRHLPAPARANARLLDIGCGSGAFLSIAQACGYGAQGLDADPAAVATARARGHDVRHGVVPGSGFEPASFDHVTLSHVLEHLHYPKPALAEIFALLRPGGRLWLTQPNPQAAGLDRYGPYWRGLEPPRHLALYTVKTLGALLEELGFEQVRPLPPEPSAHFYFRQSLAMKQGLDPYGPVEPEGWAAESIAADQADAAAASEPLRAESLTMIAFKPPAPGRASGTGIRKSGSPPR